MKPSLQKLQKFFKLEAERGYDNHAVVGGLERMLDRWEAEARADSLAEDLIQLIAARIRDYPRLSPTSRAETLEGLWRRIQRTEEVPAPRPGPQKTPPPTSSPRPQSQEGREGGRPDSGGRVRSEPRPATASQAAGQPPDSLNAESNNSSNIGPSIGPVNGPVTGEAASEGRVPSFPTPPIPAPRPASPARREQGREMEAEYSGEEAEEEGWEVIPEEEKQPASYRRMIEEENVPPVDPAALNASVRVLPGVGARHAQSLARLGLSTLRDLLYYFPRRYDDYSQLKPINRLWYGEEVTVIGTVQSVNVRSIRGGTAQVVEAVVSDGTGALRVTWFNQPWIAKRLKGQALALSGKVDQYLGRLVMSSPEWEPLEEQQISTNRIVPVYPLTANITQRWLRRMMNAVITYWAPRVPDPLPADLRREAGLMSLPMALLQAHFPDSTLELKAARERLAFDEILLLQLGVLRQKRAWQTRTARIFTVEPEWLADQVSCLPFALTSAQQRVLGDLLGDLASGRPMNRLIQGDVGSGKTILAALAIAAVARAGSQAAMMAPTSILAEQHYKTLLRVLAFQTPSSEPVADKPFTVGVFPTPEPEAATPPTPPVLHPEEIRLLVGSTPEAEKREILTGLADGSIKVVVGTHALIEDPVAFKDLQLAIVDEQHRFGVEQRASLRSKGDNPHLLVMTATPIPRSLALTVYGDLDLSVIDEMPPGRQPVATYVLPPRERERAYSLVRTQVTSGRQAFIIYPLVEESEKSEAKAAVEEYARLQKEIFPKLRLGLLHGRMKPEEKDEVMARFRDGENQILVSTSVIEVGVDVPNATVMIIEGAEHFGLAQLHQFRGRVGRGSDKSYCLLIPNTPDSVENERLQVMTGTNDGFVLAERDLDQRGPGQFLGTRQSGYSELQLAKLTDLQLIEKARSFAQNIFEKDSDLERPEFQLLAAALDRFWGDGKGDIS